MGGDLRAFVWRRAPRIRVRWLHCWFLIIFFHCDRVGDGAIFPLFGLRAAAMRWNGPARRVGESHLAVRGSLLGFAPVGVDGVARAMRWNRPVQRVGESHPAVRGSWLALALAFGFAAYIFLSSGVLLTP